MGRASKPWLRHKGKAPEKEYPKRARKKRSYKWALFWLILFGYYGAHRFYLWDYKKAWTLIAFYNLTMISALIIFADNLFSEDDPRLVLVFLLYWLLVFLFERPRLKVRVETKNKEHLLN
jgi:hypothetical protein